MVIECIKALREKGEALVDKEVMGRVADADKGRGRGKGQGRGKGKGSEPPRIP
jgi:hypothetical protein